MRSSQSNTRVHILRNPQNWYAHIIVSPAVESVTYVFTIDTTEGAICYSGTPMIDVFPTHRGAYECIRSKFDSVCMKEAKGLIGACIDNGKLVIAVIEACRRSATLPGGHTVKRIEKVSFVTIPLLAQANKGGQYALGKFRVNDNHFYSESVDLTRPYPSGHDTHDYDHQFCWNEKWRAPFVQRGAPFACVVMLQGYCGSCDSTTYIARRSVLNPLTRYSARGLNETGSPGNEIECELIFAVGEKCASNCWRRGSVPIAWRTNVVVMATHVVHDEEMWKKQTHSYFKGISDRFGGVPVQVVCLLDHDQNEMKVSKAYENAVSGIENVRFVNYDLKAVEESVVVADTERLLEPFMSEHAFNTEEGKQKLLLRFNCADSLDRTNIATFAWARILARAQGVGENVMKWLVKAFLESGDVVSILCAGTEACRSQAIRRLAAGTEDAKSDKLIGIERRLGYLFVDNERDKSIMAWITETEGHKNVFNVDPMHLSLMNTSSDIPPSVNESVIGLDQTVGLLKCSSASHEILIRLPQPMVLTVFRILLLPSVPSMRPPRAFALSCGSNVNSRYVWMNSVPLPEVREPTLMRYSLRHAEKWNIQVPHDIKALEPASFVWVTFVNESNEINIGNISIDCEIPSRFTRYKSTNMRWSLDRLNEYKEQLGQVTGNTRPSLKDYASLELARVQKGISVTERNIALACMGFNPSVGDIRHYLRQQQGECSYCWSPLNDSDVAVSLHRKLKCVLSPTRSDDSIHKFPICCECTESLQSSEEVISELESRVLSGTDTVDFSPKRWVLEDFGDRVNVAVGPSARFYQFPDGAGDINCVLSDVDGARWTMENTKAAEVRFVVSLSTLSLVSGLEITFDGELPLNVAAAVGAGAYCNMEINGMTASLEFPEPVESISVWFKVHTSADMKALTLTKAVCYGKFIEKKTVDPRWFAFEVARFTTGAKKQYPFVWDAFSHTSTYVLPYPGVLKRVTFKVNRTGHAESLMLALLHGDQPPKLIPIIVPRPNLDYIEVSFRICTSTRVSTIKIYYLDVCFANQIKPLETFFLFE